MNIFSGLKQICHSRNVIDVAALDSHNLQQHEYLERTKMYNAKVQQILSANRSKLSKKPKCILEDIVNPEQYLHSEPISNEDLNMVNIICLCILTEIHNLVWQLILLQGNIMKCLLSHFYS